MAGKADVPVLRLAIVGKNDIPIYEHDFLPPSGTSVPTDRTPYIQELVLHAALDNIEDQQWLASSSTTPGLLKNVDRFNRMSVTALVTAGNAKLLLLHSENRPSEESIRLFLLEIAGLYTKVMLNPLRDADDRITSQHFHSAVLAAARRTNLA